MVLSTLDAIDKRLSGLVHNLNIGFLEFLITPLAFIFSYVGVPFVVLAMGLYFPRLETELRNAKLEEGATKEEVTQKTLATMFLVALINCLCVLIFTNRMKKFIGRERPANPKLVKGVTHKQRILDIRSMENNKSMPSGDSSQAGLFSAFIFLYYPLMLESWGGNKTAAFIVMGTQFGRVFY